MNLNPLVATLLMGWVLIPSRLLGAAPAAATLPTTFDLVGRWRGTLEFESMSFKMVLRLVRSEDGSRVRASIDIPEQGARDLPVGAVLYHAPDVRLEFDALRTAFVGRLLPDGLSIEGRFLEGPGGRPAPVRFRKDSRGDQPEEKPAFVLNPGEKADLRGYWRGSIPGEAASTTSIGLKIGHFTDGHFEAVLDDFEHGAIDLPAGEITQTDGLTHLPWPMLQSVFDGRLNETASEFSGTWRQGSRSVAVVFRRTNRPPGPLPDGTSFEAEPATPTDLRGDWKGTLVVGDQKLRLLLTLGRPPGPTPSYVATVNSLDQGGRALVAHAVGFSNSVLTVECPAIQGKYTATLNKAGTLLEGQWEQGGMKTPLNLDRATPAGKFRGRL